MPLKFIVNIDVLYNFTYNREAIETAFKNILIRRGNTFWVISISHVPS